MEDEKKAKIIKIVEKIDKYLEGGKRNLTPKQYNMIMDKWKKIKKDLMEVL